MRVSVGEEIREAAISYIQAIPFSAVRQAPGENELLRPGLLRLSGGQSLVDTRSTAAQSDAGQTENDNNANR